VFTNLLVPILINPIYGDISEVFLQLEKVKEPIFVTKDGVDIYPKMVYWCVNIAEHLWSLFEQTANERTRLNKTVKAFSTKERAQGYIDSNKPKYSDIQLSKAFIEAGLCPSVCNNILAFLRE
jgi:hypothetical protein